MIRTLFQFFKDFFTKFNCNFCKDSGWVCENHPEKEFDFIHNCGGAGMPCECNNANPPWDFKKENKCSTPKN